MAAPTTAEVLEGVRAQMADKPDKLAEAEPLADALLEQLRERIPGADPALVAAVLLHSGSYVGYRVLDQLSEAWIKADSYHMRTANTLVVAGQKLLDEAGQR